MDRNGQNGILREEMAIQLVNGSPHHSTDRLAELIWTVDENLMAFLFGTPENWHRLFSMDWQADEGIVNHSHSVVAVDSDQILGVLIGYNANIIDRLFEATLSRWLKEEHPAKAEYLEQAFNKMDRLFPHPAEGSFYVLDLAVDVNNRKGGVGRKLMEWAVSQARSQDLSALELDVEADNPAVGFYKKLGMIVEIETLVPEIAKHHDVGRHFHMKLTIN